jgi:hypothetical protein
MDECSAMNQVRLAEWLSVSTTLPGSGKRNDNVWRGANIACFMKTVAAIGDQKPPFHRSRHLAENARRGVNSGRPGGTKYSACQFSMQRHRARASTPAKASALPRRPAVFQPSGTAEAAVPVRRGVARAGKLVRGTQAGIACCKVTIDAECAASPNLHAILKPPCPPPCLA